MRVRTGDPVSLADDSGSVWQATVTDLSSGVVRATLDEHVAIDVDRPTVTVIQSLPKGRKMEEVITRLSEVGVDRIIPVHTARSVKQLKGPKAEKALARWRALAVAAAQQSRRARLLKVEAVGSWPVAGARGVILYERATTPLASALADLGGGEELAVAVGPEGGFETGEVEMSGLVPVALGRGILRTETAGLVGSSVVLHHLGRLG